MKSWQFRKLKNLESLDNIRLVINSGHLKSKICKFSGGHPLTVSLSVFLEEDADEKCLLLHYSVLDILDKQGKVIQSPVLDAVGKEISVGDYIAFGINTRGSKRHNLCIGKVFEISEIGTISVHKISENGIKFPTAYKLTFRIPDSCSTLRLPMNENDFLHWVLNDFNDFSDSV